MPAMAQNPENADFFVGKTALADRLGVNSRTVDREVRRGTLPGPVAVSAGRVGWRNSDVDRLIADRTAASSHTVRPSSHTDSGSTTHHEAAFAPADGLFASAAATALRMNTMWQQGGMDAVWANTRKPGEPLLEWPALIASAHDEPAVVLVRWDARSPLTKDTFNDK